MSNSIEYGKIAELLAKGSTPLQDAASTLEAYQKGPKGLISHLINARVDNRLLGEDDQKLLDQALQMIQS
jgi:hypothetical protein